MKPGDRLVGGTVCKVTDAGVYLGREAGESEEVPPFHTEHKFGGGRRAFLSDDQGPHNAKEHGALLKPAKGEK
jgi:hypothetical protein